MGEQETKAYCNTQRTSRKKAALKWNSAIKLLFIAILLNRENFATITAFSPYLSSRKYCRVRNNAFSLRMTYDSTTPFPCFESVVLSIESSEKVEAEILNDLAHIVSDYLTALAPTTYLLRLLLIVGRLLGLSSGYVSDHAVLLDELFLQAVPLALLSVLLYKSVVPVAQSMLIATDALDKEAFNLLFSPVGISWAQFKTLKVTTLDWIEVLPGTLLIGEVDSIRTTTGIHQKKKEDRSTENENSGSQFPPLFWLYKGDVVFSLKGTTITYSEQSEATSINDPSSAGLLFDMRFLYALDSPKIQVREQQPDQVLKYFLKGDNSNVNTMLDKESKEYLLATIKAGSNGARLLRINSQRLSELLELDDQLRNSFRTLIITSLQRQASNLLKILAEDLERQNDRELDSNFGLEFEE